MFDIVLKWLAKPIVKAILILSAATYVTLGPFLAYKWGEKTGYSAGFEAGKLDMASEYAAAYSLKEEEIKAVNDKLDETLRALEEEKGNVKTRVVVRYREAEEVLNANPDFGSIVRPAELDALRVRELREINQTLGAAAD